MVSKDKKHRLFDLYINRISIKRGQIYIIKDVKLHKPFIFKSIKRKKLKKNLPPIFPIMIYSGAKSWKAPFKIQELILHKKLFSEYIPNFKIYPVIENNLNRAYLRQLSSALSKFFLLETSGTEEDVKQSAK